jgi:gluconolactonase
MAWYRIKVTIPEKVADTDIAGSAVWFRITVDDYGEVYINGSIELAFGKSGRGAVSGFNTPNEVKLTDNAKPGQTFQIAVLAINGPFGNPPNNYIFFRAPTALRFYRK